MGLKGDQLTDRIRFVIDSYKLPVNPIFIQVSKRNPTAIVEKLLMKLAKRTTKVNDPDVF